jgi:DNA-binding response OmpR family regulator
MEAVMHTDDDVIHVGELEIRAFDGLLVAGGRTVTLSVREFELLVALARQAGRIVRRDALYELVWGGTLRPGDRSIDVYVRKLRVKLAQVLPQWRFIHTHVGFGYRLDPEPSPPFHNLATTR